ncbi:MAG: hypothetical protein ACRCVG_03555, partial [Methanobacteriaceae archaeon]
MNFTDLNINGSNFHNDLALAKEASYLGWKSVFFTYSPNNYNNAVEYINDLQEEVNSNLDLDNTNNTSNINNINNNCNNSINHNNNIHINKNREDIIKINIGLNIISKNPNELQKMVKKY